MIKVIVVYPSQVDSFKKQVDIFCECFMAQGGRRLSKFKRLDLFAEAFGHKNFSQLTQSSKFHHQQDSFEELSIFESEPDYERCFHVFVSVYQIMDERTFASVYAHSRQDWMDKRLGVRLLSDTKKALEKEYLHGEFDEDALSIADKSEKNPLMNFIFSEDDYAISKGFIEHVRRIEEQNTPKISRPKMVVDISEMPSESKDILMAHSSFREFVYNLGSQDIEFSFLSHPLSNGIPPNRDWKIKVLFDTWSSNSCSQAVIDQWALLSEWMLKFFSTERVQVVQRIGVHRFSHIVVQHLKWIGHEQELSKLNEQDAHLYRALIRIG